MAAKRRIRRKIRRKAPSVRRGRSAQVMVGGARDPAERVAEQAVSGVVSSQKAAGGASAAAAAASPAMVHRAARASPVVAPGRAAAPAPKAAANAINSLGEGRSLSRAERAHYEPRFNADLSAVRIHEGRRAEVASRHLGARAFTLGTDIGLAREGRNPETLTHELAHVVEDDRGTQPVVRRDLAVDPAHPDAVAAVLTPRQRQRAIDYNKRRFEDPFTIRIIRDVFGGISDVPAVIDDDFIDATLQWQAERGLSQDGKFGPTTTRTMVRELQAEGQPRLARLLRSDNYVRVHTRNGPTFTPMNVPIAQNLRFQWDIGFSTSLRNGWIVQRIDNVWNEHVPAGTPHVVQTPRYWEAWQVNNGGNVTPAIGNINDMWTRVLRVGTHGNWRMRGRLFTVLNLPAAFGAGAVPDAGILQSTAALSANQQDRLGLPEGFTSIELNEAPRTIGGEWNGQGAPATWFNRRV
ncbi:DUF4157 domain-containing protein [Kordiimonas marina]|uniref:eCIS core domain-containing protein n=1 Tax=Kordiimonas marina TaxID=2872312 RepID=UPI001FF3842D|nr:DUF4157 domain-containing protein [Kordiimonas marina]MCJ9429307.1 DUF4157 domain-containing protein [Kordiimonas marina]